ncbi:hypothetical protein IPH92_03185 [Candidatus Kaiserbacteria bacterium]|nr:MAG: hypothetical protein IPH92_03185 [Candidatus Kaiserbacteria bacterium]
MILRTLTPVLTIIIAILLFVFFVNPKYDEIVAVQAEIAEYEDAVLKYNNFTSKLEAKISTKLNRPAIENERLDRFVPEEIDTTQLLVDIESLSRRHSLLFGNIQVESGDTDLVRSNATSENVIVKSDELQTADISFAVIGTYEQFKMFLLDIEKSMTLFEVIKISLDADDLPFQQYEVTVRAYSLPEM